MVKHVFVEMNPVYPDALVIFGWLQGEHGLERSLLRQALLVAGAAARRGTICSIRFWPRPRIFRRSV